VVRRTTIQKHDEQQQQQEQQEWRDQRIIIDEMRFNHTLLACFPRAHKKTREGG
jgi:hypothetical protein